MSNRGNTITIATADGPFSFTVAGGAVIASWWGDGCGLATGEPEPDAGSQDAIIKQTSEAVTAYYAGDFGKVMAVPVQLDGTEFQNACWQALRGVEAGDTVSYGELAHMVGRPQAARAVGSAMAHNPVPLFVPCHRVVRADGSVGEFGFGTPLKEALLARERSMSH